MENISQQPETEKPEVITPSPEVVEEPKLSRREALEVSITAEETKKEEPAGKVEPLPVKEELPPLDPPAEYTGAAKTAFQKAPREVQQDILRLHASHREKLQEIKTASREYEGIKALADSISPYLKATGTKEPTEVAMKKAIAMWQEFNQDDPGKAKAAAATYLRAKGIPVPRELEAVETSSAPDLSAQLSPLQERLNALESERAQEIATRTQAIGNQMWQSFEASKNAAGKPKYADIQGNSESALRLSRSIGTLVWDDSPLARQFIASVKNRIPNATAEQLLHEAYVFSGGKVDDSEATKSHSATNHLERSNRAASSKPGRGTNSAASNGVIHKMTRQEALARAIRESRNED